MLLLSRTNHVSDDDCRQQHLQQQLF
jgi:hypothetical protein